MLSTIESVKEALRKTNSRFTSKITNLTLEGKELDEIICEYIASQKAFTAEERIEEWRNKYHFLG